MTSTRSFRCHPEAVTAARHFVRDTLSGSPPEVLEAAELMASEVATNCVRHARTDFTVTIRTRGQIRIEVRDTGQGEPTPLSPPPRELTGRGLRIVEAMSEDWGVIPASDGKTVWFTVPQIGSSSEASTSAASSDASTRGLDRSNELGRRRTSRRWPTSCSDRAVLVAERRR